MNSGTFRVFVSSTFSDLKAERDALQAKVFPRLRELRELCERHGARFQAIDLRDLDALRSALRREVEDGDLNQTLTTGVLADRASERARAARQSVLRPQDLAATILAAAIEATAGTPPQSAALEAPADAPPLPLSFAAEQMIKTALRARDPIESDELGATEWLVGLLKRHRELVEELAAGDDLDALLAETRRQLSRGEVGRPLTRRALISRATQHARQASRPVVASQGVATVILAENRQS